MSVDDELKVIFSNPHAQTLEGVIAAGGKMSPELLIYAYEHGVFPWPHEGYPLLWFCPDERGVLDFDELHLSKSFQKWLRQKKSLYQVTVNQKFLEVVQSCRRQKRKGQRGSWINNEIERNYNLLHQSGHALSIEIMRGDVLVGGIYGVQSSRYFSCESMFHHEDNVSKLAFYEMVNLLKSQGHRWMDIQMVTSVCEGFGGKLISKEDFLLRIGL
ncbi:leucyl/phenylalanyl-tRNA--protein transferase [Pseudobdellovibrio exovorus JSS]|uniref:Leucyl/phenylalanyl-tRNA--protein transferase n=2 Tax=Pseudobdellovibrio exovorus TaxID=453816 RepID=M4V9B1_9BACT|nr:leucyl/phenylalanyl-tRNA--protein transferase [Pseudobdellovibrio exovorus JSS]